MRGANRTVLFYRWLRHWWKAYGLFFSTCHLSSLGRMTDRHEERTYDKPAERITYTNLLSRVAPYLQDRDEGDD